MSITQKGNFRWRIVALLFFATTINYIDRQVIGILKPYISEDLGWSEAGYGTIVTAFQAAYAIGLLITGGFLDRFGTRIGYAVAIIIWSLAGMAHAAARSVVGFSVARFTLGIGESANFPAAVKATAEWFPKKERAFATGLFNSGSNIGAIIAPLIVAASYSLYGWQWAFIITGTLGFIWLIFWLLSYHIPQKHSKVKKEELQYILSDNEGEDKPIRWIKIFPHKETIAICLSRFVSDWVWWFFLFWTPDFLEKHHGVDIKEVVLPLIIIYTFSSFGSIAGGWLSSAFIKSGKNIDFARKTTILICAICVLPIIIAYQTSSMWVAICLIALATAAHQGWAANIFTVVSDIYPKNAVGSMIGLSGFAGSVGGAFSATFVGLILEYTGSYFFIFLIAGSAYLIAWLILKIMIPKIRPINI